jgi:hypothetical protein
VHPCPSAPHSLRLCRGVCVRAMNGATASAELRQQPKLVDPLQAAPVTDARSALARVVRVRATPLSVGCTHVGRRRVAWGMDDDGGRVPPTGRGVVVGVVGAGALWRGGGGGLRVVALVRARSDREPEWLCRRRRAPGRGWRRLPAATPSTDRRRTSSPPPCAGRNGTAPALCGRVCSRCGCIR